jgi:hypothetical protein
MKNFKQAVQPPAFFVFRPFAAQAYESNPDKQKQKKTNSFQPRMNTDNQSNSNFHPC